MSGFKTLARAAFVVAQLVPSTAWAGAFLDISGIHELQPQERLTIANPQPVQILFQFQSNGSPNGRATGVLKKNVTDDVKASGLFSDVSDAPVASGAVLSITINDVADLKSAESHGILTGLTLGLAGSLVSDQYVCTVEYLGGTPGAGKITETAAQTLFATIGLKSDPPNTEKMESLDAAVYKMLREVIGNSLNDLAYDHGFNPAAPPKPLPPALASTTPASAPPATAAATPPANAAPSATAAPPAGATPQAQP
jgi:hypothetical protein